MFIRIISSATVYLLLAESPVFGNSFNASLTEPSGKVFTNRVAVPFFSVVTSFKPSTADFSSELTTPSTSTSYFLSFPACVASSATFTA